MARSDILPEGAALSLTLDRYQEIMRLPEAAFNGLYKVEDKECGYCAAVWTQFDRDALAIAIKEAEEMRVHELGYFLIPTYVEDEEQEFAYPIILNMKHMIAIGSEVIVDIEDGVAVSLGALDDPVTIAVDVGTVTDPHEIMVCYPGELVEIHPYSIFIVTYLGTNIATIKIPRSRLVDPSVDTNCEPTPLYVDDANFLTTVDIKRRYLDACDGLAAKWYGGDCCCSSCVTENTHALFGRIINKRLSIVEWCYATCVAGVWTQVTACRCRTPDAITASYLSGRQKSMQTEIQTVRLAHTRLPGIMPDRTDLCSGCWVGDRELTKTWTPYGNAQGAVDVWLTDSRSKVGQGGKFPKAVKRSY